MSHNLNEQNGKHSFVSAILPAWHNLGTVLDHIFTAKEAIEFAKLDYQVALAPIYAQFNIDKTDPNRGKKVPNNFAVFRTDTRDIFGVVGSKFEVIQNTEAFSFFDAIVGEGKAIYETAGQLGKGEIIFITAKLPQEIILPGADLIKNYLLFTMGHDGTTPITCMLTPTRVVCANTLAVALGGTQFKVKIRHTISAHDRLIEAGKILGFAQVKTKETEEVLQALANKLITEEQLADYLTLVFLTKEQRIELAKAGGWDKAGLPTRTYNIMEQVFDYAHEGIGQDTKSTKGTLFGAYSGVTSYMFNLKSYRNEDARFKNLLLGGADYELNYKALETAKQCLSIY
jgi:phage/plasmid-like protein (TIGR03299 family)